jgi:hypothetical protein
VKDLPSQHSAEQVTAGGPCQKPCREHDKAEASMFAPCALGSLEEEKCSATTLGQLCPQQAGILLTDLSRGFFVNPMISKSSASPVTKKKQR